jgi:hypothetical protein
LSLEKKQQEWYGRIIEHEVRGDAWKLEFNHYMSRSKKIREENQLNAR